MESHESESFHWRYEDFDDSNLKIHGQTLFFVLVIVSLVLLITLVYIYAQWLCKRRETHAPPQRQTSSQGLDPNKISRIPIVLHQGSSGGSELECSICLGIFHDGEKAKVLPDCSHCYHAECIDNWLNKHSTCPLCRSSLNTDSPV